MAESACGPMRVSASTPNAHSEDAEWSPAESPAFLPCPGLGMTFKWKGHGPAACAAWIVPSSEASSTTTTSCGKWVCAAKSANSRGRVSASFRTGSTTDSLNWLSFLSGVGKVGCSALRIPRDHCTTWKTWRQRGRKRTVAAKITLASSCVVFWYAWHRLAKQGPRWRGGSS